MQESSENRRRRREKITVVVLLVVITLFTVAEVYLVKMSSQLPFVNSIFFFGLMNLNIVLIMLLLFLVFRNVVKLVLDERRGQRGSRLKSRLVFSFVLFAIIPTVLLFSVSAFYIKNSFDKWFSVRIGSTLQKSIEVVNNYYETNKRNAGHFVRKIAFSFDPTSMSSQKLEQRLEQARVEYGLDAVEYYPGPFAPRIFSAHPSHKEKIPRASLETLQKSFSALNGCQVQNVGVGELVRCGAFLGVGKGVVFADYFIPMSLASRLSGIELTYQDYTSNNPLNYPIKSTYFTILTMMTLLILFSAVWTGFYVAKRLSVPIEQLAKGTEEIARGNLDYEIPRLGSDELAKLVESFNQMTRDLKQKTEEIKTHNVDLKRMNKELTHRKRYIEVLLESAQSGVISLDEHGKISMLNHAAAELLRLPADDLLGKPYWAIIPEEHRAEFRELLMAVYGNAKTIRRELRVRSANNEWVMLLVTLSVLRDDKKRQMGVVAVFDDVTEMQKIQRMTAWREVAKRIAHEIKNPLTPIQLSVQRLRRRYLEKIDDDGTFDQATNIILKEVDQLKHMVSEFSSFARLPEIQQQPEDLNQLILEAVNLFRAAHEGIDFRLNLEEGLPQMQLDRAQLKRVLINLFDNAVAAMDCRGVITLETVRDRTNGLVRLVVKDEGCGIGNDVGDQLFEPYFSTKVGGMGLGLTIVQRILVDHGAFVRVARNEPKGTKFLIEFPESLTVKDRNTDFSGVEKLRLAELDRGEKGA